MKKQIYHSLVLDDTQVRYLMSGTAGINRMTCLFQLIELLMAQIEQATAVGECPEVLWQVKMSEMALAKLWKCDRKTVSKMLDKMEELAILSSVQTRRGSVHTFLCISTWGIDGKKFVNPNYVPINLRQKCATKMKPYPQPTVATNCHHRVLLKPSLATMRKSTTLCLMMV